jgi:hypothetical protein
LKYFDHDVGVIVPALGELHYPSSRVDRIDDDGCLPAVRETIVDFSGEMAREITERYAGPKERVLRLAIFALFVSTYVTRPRQAHAT